MAENAEWMGIDVSKETLEIASYPSGKGWRINYSPEEIKKLIQCLGEMTPRLIVVEATGGWENELVEHLSVADLPVVVVNPRKIRDFAKASGILAKTDRLDAWVLARFAEALKPDLRKNRVTAQDRQLKNLMARRRQLVEMIVQEKNRLAHASGRIQQEIEDHLEWLEECLKSLDKNMDHWIQDNPALREKKTILTSVPGVGNILASMLITDLPELGQVDSKQIAALVGVAPFNRDSGHFRGKRAIWGGRAWVRATLYMGTLSAIRCNPSIAPFYKRLIQAGKAPKVALTACMRKLLVILNAMTKHNTLWNASILKIV